MLKKKMESQKSLWDMWSPDAWTKKIDTSETQESSFVATYSARHMQICPRFPRPLSKYCASWKEKRASKPSRGTRKASNKAIARMQMKLLTQTSVAAMVFHIKDRKCLDLEGGISILGIFQ